MSSSRNARRKRRHGRYGKPSYSPRPKNGLTPTAMIKDEWISTYLGEERPRVITSDMVNWSTASVILSPSGDGVRKLRSRLFIE